MPEIIRVEWETGSTFLIQVERLTIYAARSWGGEPIEALGYVWKELRRRFLDGGFIDPQECRLATIIRRKVNDFYTRSEKPSRSRVGWVSLTEVAEPSHARTTDPTVEIAFRELHEAFETALAELSPRRREAVLVKLDRGEHRTMDELARCWGTTAQNARKHASKGLEEVRTLLASFDPRSFPEVAR